MLLRKKTMMIAALAAPLMVISALPAQAATTRSFSRSATTYLSTLGRCVVVESQGSISYSTAVDNSYKGYYVNRKVIHPAVVVRTYNSCNPLTRRAKSITKVTVRQRWFSSTCSSRVGIEVGLPWGVAVQPTISCGRVKVADRKTSYGSGSTFTQYNSDTTVALANEAGIPLYYLVDYYTHKFTYFNLCIPVEMEITAYVGNVSDTYRPTIRVCVSRP